MIPSSVHDSALKLFLVLFLGRYIRTVVGVLTWLTYKPKPISENPSFQARDTSVVIPTTLKSPGQLMQCLKRVLSCSPAAVFVVTSNANVGLAEKCCTANFDGKVQILGVNELNKRYQILEALGKIETAITVFADDDVFWPPRYLDYLLAIFEDPKVGAGGTRQRVCRSDQPSCWNFLGISYLERRVWNNVTTNAVDGSISTLSGRTAAYRTQILKTNEFFQYFSTDSWCGHRLNSDDDKCLTRYVFAHGWNIAIQCDHRSVIETTVEDNPKYIAQCIRWARAHWRGNFTVMASESYWRSFQYWWGAYVIYLGQFQTPALLVDGSFLILFSIATDRLSPKMRLLMGLLLCLWIFLTKILKLIPHFCRHPQDIKFIPLSIVFSYLHGFINIYALLTLHVTAWGSQDLAALARAGADGDAETMPSFEGDKVDGGAVFCTRIKIEKRERLLLGSARVVF